MFDSNPMVKRVLTQEVRFNFEPTDFTSLMYKEEIQYIYSNWVFESFDPIMAVDDRLDPNEYNAIVRSMKNESLEAYTRLHTMQLRGIGPAEIAMFLLTKNGYLGGGISSGHDLIIGDAKYEIKAVKWKSKATKDRVSDFKLSSNIEGMTLLEGDLQRSFFVNGYTDNQGTTEIRESLFRKFEETHPKEYYELEGRYKELASKNFANKVVFIQTERGQPDFGEILAIKHVTPDCIKMERYTNKSIKPIIKID